MLKNAKHELFCQYRAEGRTEDDAYELAGYKRNRGNAARLNAKESIIARVHEIQSRRAKMADVTVEALTKRYNEAIDKATEDKSHPAVMAGLNNLAKLHGLIIDKRLEGTLDEMSDDAIAESIERRLASIASRGAKGAGEGSGGTGATAESQPDPELSPVPEADGISRKG